VGHSQNKHLLEAKGGLIIFGNASVGVTRYQAPQKNKINSHDDIIPDDIFSPLKMVYFSKTLKKNNNHP
jgi:hypothetical protein